MSKEHSADDDGNDGDNGIYNYYSSSPENDDKSEESPLEYDSTVDPDSVRPYFIKKSEFKRKISFS